jgi:hypothetical protein
MKIRFRRTITVDVEKTRLQEVWEHMYQKWDEVQVESVTKVGDVATIRTISGDFLFNVPQDAFETLTEEVKKKPVL